LSLWLLLLSGCYTSPMRVPTGTVRDDWIAQRTTSTRAQEAPAECPVSEAELVASAVARSSAAGIKRAEARATRAAAEVPDAKPLTLRLTNFRTDIGFADRAEATLRYAPARPGTIDAERDTLQRAADELSAEARDEERRSRFEVRSALARARAADTLATLAAGAVTALEPEVQRLRDALVRKAANEVVVTQAEVELAEAQGELAEQSAARERWSGEALAYGGYSPECHLSFSPYAAPADEPLAGLQARALASHPLIDARWAAERKVDAEWHGPEAEAYPWFRWVQLGLERQAMPLEDELHVNLGVAIDLPIFQWGGEASDAHEAARDAAREETRLTVQAIATEVAAAKAELAAALARLAGMPAALGEDRLDALQKAVRSGYADPRDLMTVERDLRRNERRRVEASLAVEEAYARLEAAVGAQGQ